MNEYFEQLSFDLPCVFIQQLSHAIAQIVKPGVAVNQLPQFFWNHFEKDVRAFAKAIGHTPEDASVVLHWFLNTLVSQQRQGG